MSSSRCFLKRKADGFHGALGPALSPEPETSSGMLTLSRWLTVVSKSTHLKPNSASLPSQLPRPACSRTRRLLPSCGSGSKPWRPPWRGTRHSQTCSTSRGLHPHDVEALVACHLLVRVTTVSPGLLQGPPHSCPCPPLRSVLSTATWGPLRCPPQTPGSAAKPGPCAGPAARTPSLLPEHAGHTPHPPRGLTPARHSLLGEPPVATSDTPFRRQPQQHRRWRLLAACLPTVRRALRGAGGVVPARGAEPGARRAR